MLRLRFQELRDEFQRILVGRGFSEENAGRAAQIFAENSLDGVYSHGVNRFPRVISYLDQGEIDPKASADCELRFGALERWNGNRGLGPLNARLAMERACEIAGEYGIGMVALRNNNHWMRGGSYGWQAAEAGFIGICWSNTMPNMPAWGGKERRIGNNPLILAFPKSDGAHIVVDCALSQFSYGKLEEARQKGALLSVPGGYDEEGRLTRDPAAIEKSWRVLPIGCWKGSGLSILLDLIATAMSGGNSVREIGKLSSETGLSQILIAMDPRKLCGEKSTDQIAEELVKDLRSSTPLAPGGQVFYPGERERIRRRENSEHGIPVLEEVWEQIKAL